MSRPTVRQAVNALKLDGLVTTISGRGTFVTGTSEDRMLTAISELTAAMNRLASAVETANARHEPRAK